MIRLPLHHRERFGVSALAHTRCRLFNESTSTSEDNRVASTDDSLAVGSGGTGGRDDAVVLSDYASINEGSGQTARIGGRGQVAQDEAVILGDQASLQTGGAKIGGNNSGTITINEAAGLDDLAKTFAETVSQINDTASLDRENSNALVSDALGKVTSLSESKQTDGISSLGRIALWGLFILALAFVLWAWLRRGKRR